MDYFSSFPSTGGMLEGLLRVVKLVSFRAGEVVYKQGEAVGEGFWVLQSGSAQSRRVETRQREEGAAPMHAPMHGIASRSHSSSMSQARANRNSGANSTRSLSMHVPSSASGQAPSSPPLRSARSSLVGQQQLLSLQASLSPPGSPRPPSLCRALSSRSSGGGAPLALVLPPPTPAAAAGVEHVPVTTETVQLLVPGNAFGYLDLSSEATGGQEATSHVVLARRRTLRLWHLLRLTVRRDLRLASGEEEEESLEAGASHSTLARLTTHGPSAGDPEGAVAQRGKELLMGGRNRARVMRNTSGNQGGAGLKSPTANLSTGASIPLPALLTSDVSSSSHGLSSSSSAPRVRSETVTALTPCTAFFLSFYALSSVSFEQSQLRVEGGVSFLSHLRFFQTWTLSRLRHLWSLLLPRSLKKGEILWRQGSQAEEMAFIESGSLSLSREVLVTEGHRHPVRSSAATGAGGPCWECMESSVVLSGGAFEHLSGRQFAGEEMLLSTLTGGGGGAGVREFTARCRSEGGAKVYLLRKRYAHLLLHPTPDGNMVPPSWLEDVARVRRLSAASSVAKSLSARYPSHASRLPFPPQHDWRPNLAPQWKGEPVKPAPDKFWLGGGAHMPGTGMHAFNAAAASAATAAGVAVVAHLSHLAHGLAALDLSSASDFLFLEAGAILVRWDPSIELLRGPTAVAGSSSEADSTPAQTPSAAAAAAVRPRKVYRLFRAPAGGHLEPPLSQYYSPMEAPLSGASPHAATLTASALARTQQKPVSYTHLTLPTT